MLTRDQLDAIKGRADAATPGPWDVCVSGASEHVYVATDNRGDARICEHQHPICDDRCVCDFYFIAAARTDIPALLAHVEELEKRLARHNPASFESVCELVDQFAAKPAKEAKNA